LVITQFFRLLTKLKISQAQIFDYGALRGTKISWTLNNSYVPVRFWISLMIKMAREVEEKLFFFEVVRQRTFQETPEAFFNFFALRSSLCCINSFVIKINVTNLFRIPCGLTQNLYVLSEIGLIIFSEDWLSSFRDILNLRWGKIEIYENTNSRTVGDMKSTVVLQNGLHI